jgi:lambda family phage portal protein
MSLFDRIAEKAFRAVGAVDMDQRQYAAGKNTRLVGDRHNSNLSANQDIRGAGRAMRANSRALARDNDHMIGFLKKLDSNVIGTAGLKLQVDAKKSTGEKKEDLNRKIENEWKRWSRKKNCDVTGQESLRGIASLSLRTCAVDGEFLMRLIFDPSSEFGLKLQMLDVDWLDEDYNDDKLQNGNRIVMSIEYDPYDKPVAYYFTDPKWSTTSVPNLKLVPASSSVRRLRIPADQIIHRFIRERVGQGRGVVWAHGAMLTMNQLDGFDEAELVGARINASNMAFVSPPAPLDPSDTQGAGIDTEVAPGQVLELPAGYTVHEFSPNKPQDSNFSTRMLRKVASSLGISYSTLTSDLTEVNFSSIRAGTIEEREVWRMLQAWLAEQLYQDIFEKWLMFNIRLLPVSALDQVMYPIWRGRGFEWVDPLKDVTASALAVDRGFETLTDVLGERGKDFEETIDQIAYEKSYMEQKGVTLADTVSMQAAQAQIAADAAEAKSKDEQGGDKNKKDKVKK